MVELKGWEKFKDALVGSGYQQVDLANAIGKSDSAVSNWARGVSRPRPDDCFKIAAFLDRDAAEVFGWFRRTVPVTVNLRGSAAGVAHATGRLQATPARVEVTAGRAGLVIGDRAQAVARTDSSDTLTDTEALEQAVLALMRIGVGGGGFSDEFVLEINELASDARRRQSDANEGTEPS